MAHWLEKLCDPKAKSPTCRQPWWLDGGKTWWTAATDGRRLVYLRDRQGTFVLANGKPEVDLRKFLKPDAFVTDHGPINFAELLSFAGSAPWTVPCPACRGISKDNQHVHCYFCDDEGECRPELRRGWLTGVPIDLNLLAPVLAELGGVATVTIHTLGEDSPMWIVDSADSWRLVLMAMKVVEEPGDDSPLWPTAPAFPAKVLAEATR